MNSHDLTFKLFPWETPAHYSVLISNKSYISFHDGKKILDKRILSAFEINLICKKLDSIKIPLRLKSDLEVIRTDPDIQSKLNIKSDWGNLSITWSNHVEEIKPFSSILTLENLLFELLPLDDLPFEYPPIIQ